MARRDEIEQQVARLLGRAAALSATAAQAAAGGDVMDALRLEEQADKLRNSARKAIGSRERTRADLSNANHGVPAARAEVGVPARDVAIAALNELEVPSAPRTVSEYAAVRFGTDIDPRAMASLRRDEQRSWRNAGALRAAYIVPALEGHRFLPLRGKVALSSWPLRMRLIGPWSERADHLRATRSIAKQTDWLIENRPEVAERMIPLLEQYARTIPGVEGNSPAAVEYAAAAELALIDGPDLDWRTEAEERAKAVLDEAGHLWGAAPPRAVGQRAG